VRSITEVNGEIGKSDNKNLTKTNTTLTVKTILNI